MTKLYGLLAPHLTLYYVNLVAGLRRSTSTSRPDEAIRADELFTTGTSLSRFGSRFWSRFRKQRYRWLICQVRNNFFYELGLAHTAKIPVVFTSAVVKDVLLDLRHLRVIIYDIREPEWAPGLLDFVRGLLDATAFRPADDFDFFADFVEDFLAAFLVVSIGVFAALAI
jgi:hypothetical protein